MVASTFIKETFYLRGWPSLSKALKRFVCVDSSSSKRDNIKSQWSVDL